MGKIFSLLFFAITLFSCKYENKTDFSQSLKLNARKDSLDDTILAQANKTVSNSTINNSFLGDSTLSQPDYFTSISQNNGTKKLENQNILYKKYYSDSKNNEVSIFNSRGLNIKIVKEKFLDKGNMKINLYTFFNGKKIDSIQFYRDFEGNGFGSYNCLSYYDKKADKIWQLQYFPVTPNPSGDSPGIISFTRKSINSEGMIKVDSTYYLDEYLEAEMDKYNLYY